MLVLGFDPRGRDNRTADPALAAMTLSGEEQYRHLESAKTRRVRTPGRKRVRRPAEPVDRQRVSLADDTVCTRVCLGPGAVHFIEAVGPILFAVGLAGYAFLVLRYILSIRRPTHYRGAHRVRADDES